MSTTLHWVLTLPSFFQLLIFILTAQMMKQWRYASKDQVMILMTLMALVTLMALTIQLILIMLKMRKDIWVFTNKCLMTEVLKDFWVFLVLSGMNPKFCNRFLKGNVAYFE